MVEYLSDYHFRLRFMALRPEVWEYIIKTHSKSAENSTLAQIRSACEDSERSNEYGKQVAATQTRLGGSRTPGNQQSSRVQSNARSHSRPPRPPQRANTSSHNDKTTTSMARTHGEGHSKNTATRMTPKPDPKAKPDNPHKQKNETRKVSCFICGGDHYADKCPPEN